MVGIMHTQISSGQPGSPHLSIVLPVYNERGALATMLAQLHQSVDRLAYSCEVICVNDGSEDGSFEELERLRAEDERIVVLHLTRNFGKEAAILAGLDHARGEAVIVMDADGQHPPELIPELLEKWERGAEIVHTRKRRRGQEPLLYNLLTRVFYRLFRRLAGFDLKGLSDYKLLDRVVVTALRDLPERKRFFRGLVAWVGFRSETVEFDVRERIGGAPGWGVRRLFTYAIDNVLSFTMLPLYLTAASGVLITNFGVIMGGIALVDFARGEAVTGFTTVILLQVIFAGSILTAVGVVAIYLAKVLDEVKARPAYLVRPDPTGGRRTED